MTGKTHVAVSAAVISVLLTFTQTPARHLGAASAQSTHGATDLVAYSILLLVGTVAGLFPDLDAPNSTLQILPTRVSRRLARQMCVGGKKRSLTTAAVQASLSLMMNLVSLLLLGISAFVRAFTHHRGFTHTIWCTSATTILVALTSLLTTASLHQSMAVGAGWLAGYASHLAADACTPSGIPLFGTRKRASVTRTHYAGISETHKRLQSRYNVGIHRDATFHLLPVRLRVTTGTFADTVIIRGVSWLIFLVAVVGFVV